LLRNVLDVRVADSKASSASAHKVDVLLEHLLEGLFTRFDSSRIRGRAQIESLWKPRGSHEIATAP
jgi:hypothetical protein